MIADRARTEACISLWGKGNSVQDIAEIVGVNRNLVSRALRAEGIDTSTKSSLENKLFKGRTGPVFKIGCEKSEYYLGFLLADGCVHNGRLRIEIQRRDEKVLQTLVDFMDMDININRHTRKGENETSLVAVRSARLCAELSNYGIVPNKTGTEKCPEILKGSRHFWRGMVDGDGCITLPKTSSPRLYLCGTEEICNQFLDYCKGIVPEIKTGVIKSGSIYRISFCGRTALKLLENLYEGAEVSLERKYNKYLEMKAFYEERDSE